MDRGMIEERGTRQRRSAVGESFRSADEVGAGARRFGTLVGRFGRERTWSFQAAVNFEPAAFAGSAIARRGARRRADLPVRLGFASARTREPGRRAAVKEKAIVIFVSGSNGKCGGRALRRDGRVSDQRDRKGDDRRCGGGRIGGWACAPLGARVV